MTATRSKAKWDRTLYNQSGIPREALTNNLEAYRKDLRARVARGEDVQDRIAAVEKRLKTLKRRVA